MDNITIFDLPYSYREPIYLDKGGLTVELHPCPTAQSVVDAVQWALDLTITDSPIISAPVRTMFRNLGLLKAFTNFDMDFATKEPADIYAAYDAVLQSDILSDIIEKGDKKMVDFFTSSFEDTLQNIVSYRQSVAGVLDTIAGEAKMNTQAIEAATTIMQDDKALENVRELFTMANELQSPPTV